MSDNHEYQTRYHSPISGKTLPPNPPQPAIRRNRLESLLNDTWKRKLTLLKAPAGYGKTALLQIWSARQKHPVGWLRLDERDVNPRRFMMYLARAIPGMPDSLISSIMNWVIDDEGLTDNELESIAAEWIESIEYENQPILLIIDAAEHLTHPSALLFLRLLIDYGPEHLHFLLSGRQVPLIETSASHYENSLILDTGHLRLKEDELAEYVRRKIGIRLNEQRARELVERTGGWFTAVQAYLPYLREQKYDEDQQVQQQVLHQLSPYFHESGLRQVPDLALLALSTAKPHHISFFRRLPELSDEEQFENLVRQWPFLTLYSDRPDENVIHPLFADWLKLHLTRISTADYAHWKRQLAEHAEAEGHFTDALEYALEAGDLDLFANMVNRHNEKLLRGSHDSLLALLGTLSEDQLRRYPALAFFYAWSLIHIRRFADAERLADLLESEMSSGGSPLFHDTTEPLAGYLASLRSMIHLSRGEAKLGLSYTKKAYEALQRGGKPFRRSLYLHPGTSSLLKGEYGHYGMVYPVMAVYRYLEKRWSGRDPGYAVILVLLGQCYYEINRLDLAEQYLQGGLHLSVELDFTGTYIPAELSWARLKWKAGETFAAFAALQGARERMLRTQDKRRIAVIDACETELHIKQGNIRQVKNWLHIRGNEIVHNIGRTRMYEAIILIRAHVMLGHLQEAHKLGERVLHQAESYSMTCYLIEINFLLAQINRSQGDIQQSMRKLHRALTLANRHRYFNTLVDEGAALTPLLLLYLEQNSRGKLRARRYTERLLQHLPRVELHSAVEDSPLSALTIQEKRVYACLMQGFDNRAIAAEMSISLETVKRHCRHLYQKLGVRNRHEATERYKQ